MPQNIEPAPSPPAASAEIGKTGSEVMRLISLGKSKQAVELAKEYHKKNSSPESKDLLVGAYMQGYPPTRR